MNRFGSGQHVLRLALACLLMGAMPAMAQDDEAVFKAIEAHEGSFDPKCHATATRLENFMYGTPLASATRHTKVSLQKGLILDLWRKASGASSERKTIGRADLKPFIEEALAFRILENGDLELLPAKGSLTVFPERDLRQYGSVAYALRAILAVQQDQMLSGEFLTPLDDDAVAALKELIDAATLASLAFADHQARADHHKEVQPAVFTDAWHKVIGKPGAQAGLSQKTPQGAEGQPFLRKIIRQKLASYNTYNKIADKLFFNNTKSFYSRYDWPESSEEVVAVTRAFSNVTMNFLASVMMHAERRARQAGEPVIREIHVEETYAMVAPFQVNQYEDITYFFNLPRERRIVLEAYDCDSFRDSGLHWQLIDQIISSKGFPLRKDFDPFGAEMLAEGVAQMGVLIYRVAGNIAREQKAPHLKPEHILAAEKWIGQTMREHLATKPDPNKKDALPSAPGATKTGKGRFFEDATAESGIRFEHRSADWLNRFQRSFLYTTHGAEGAPMPGRDAALNNAPSFSGGGVATADLDGDLLPDILLLGGAGNALYRNRGDGTFEDVTARSGLRIVGQDGFPTEPRQPLIVDLDNDGRQDIVITHVKDRHYVFRNLGDLRFEEVGDKAGLGGEGLVGAAATAFDFDRDGLLDLYIGYYGNYLEGEGPFLSRVNRNATPNRLYRNQGNMTFVDVTKKAGVANTGWTQAVSHVDFNLDGWQDLIVANDFGVNSWYRNLGDGRFVDDAPALGTDLPCSAMNVGISDLNGDLYPDVYISNILTMVKDEKYVLPGEKTPLRFNPEKMATMRIVAANHLYTSQEDGRRYQLSDAIETGVESTGWAWDADFFDFDNDGDDDLYCVNGLNEYNLYEPTFETSDGKGNRRTLMFSLNEREQNVFFVNEGGALRQRSAESGTDLVGNARSAAYFDYDQDGDLDILLNNYHAPAVLLANRVGEKRQWLKVHLTGNPKKGSSRDAIGARVVLTTAAGKKITRIVHGSIGYMSVHPKTLHFGLGDEKSVDLVVHWPGGQTSEHRGLTTGKRHRIDQE